MNNHKTFHRLSLGTVCAAVLLALAAEPSVSRGTDAPPANATISGSIDTPAANVSVSVDASVSDNAASGKNDRDSAKLRYWDSNKTHHHGGVPVPEPAAWLSLGSLLVIGFGLVAFDQRRRRR
jgi:hypothetical protein